MAKERERKFLVDPTKLPFGFDKTGFVVEAGYFTANDPAIRVTIRRDGKSKICFKSGQGEERDEFEYLIPREDAAALLKTSPTYLLKTRYDYEGWEIDHIGLAYPEQEIWLAEWEEYKDKVAIPNPLPSWIKEEVTNKPMFTNQSIAWTFGRRK